MQDNWYFYYPYCQESSDSHYSESALVNSAASIDTSSMFTYTGIPVDPQEWSSAVAPIPENSDGSLTAPSGVAENLDYVAHASCHPAALNRTLPVPLTSCAHSTDADLRPWRSTAEAATVHAYAPQTAWKNERSLGLTQLDRSQVPSGPTDLDVFGQSWSQRGDHRHAVGAPAQPTFRWDAHYPRHAVSALPEISASSTGHAHTAGLGNVSPWMADPVLCQAPSPSNRRRYSRRPRPEHVTCDKCTKSMRRQSLRRHIREVHDHIKRPHPKSSFAAQAGP